MRSDARKKLADIQAEADVHGYHKELRAWVDNNSGAARVANALTDQDCANHQQRAELAEHRLTAARLGLDAVADYADAETERANHAERTIREIRALAQQLLADADTAHRDPFLRGCATGTTDTAQAILNTLGGNDV